MSYLEPNVNQGSSCSLQNHRPCNSDGTPPAVVKPNVLYAKPGIEIMICKPILYIVTFSIVCIVGNKK